MKKFALSLAVIAASAVWVWHEAGKTPGDDVLGEAPSRVDSSTPTVQPLAAGLPAPAINPPPSSRDDEEPHPDALPQMVPPERQRVGTAVAVDDAEAAPAVAAPLRRSMAVADVPLPHPRPRPERPVVIHAAMKVAAGHTYADGVYTGPVVDAYYGPIQIQAIVAGGRLTAIKVLQYPSDRRTSVFINRQALPLLRDEAIAAQGAEVDVVTGATLTSGAFIRSLDAALRTAHA